MIKKLNLLRMLVMLSFLTLFALSCKKDDAKESENALNDAKSWYTKLTANAKTALTASNNNTQNITKEFLWNKAQIFKFSDGKDVIGTPINVFMTNHKAANGSYMLLIYKTDHDYHSQIIYNAKNNYFSEATTTDIEAAFMVSEKNNELKSLAKGKKMTSKGANGKVMVRQDEPPVCTDWYWTTYTYDQWGNITSILSEVYVYTTCEENGGGDVEPNPEEEDIPISISGKIEFYETEYNEDDYTTPDGDVSGTSTGLPKPIKFEATWNGQRMSKSRKILWITMNDIVGYPVNESYTHPQKGPVTRHVQPTTTGKWVTIHNPFELTATLEWNYNALVRYTYANTGISNTVPYVNRVHSKFIGPFTDF